MSHNAFWSAGIVLVYLLATGSTEAGPAVRGFRGANKSGLLTHIASTKSVSLCVRMKKLTAFLELESAVRASWLVGCLRKRSRLMVIPKQN